MLKYTLFTKTQKDDKIYLEFLNKYIYIYIVIMLLLSERATCIDYMDIHIIFPFKACSKRASFHVEFAFKIAVVVIAA